MVIKMKKILILMISICLLLFTSGACLASSWQIMSGDKTLERGQVVEGDLFFSGDRLEINGEVKGDLVVWSGQIIVNGRINGSILGAAWDKLEVNGVVLGNIRGFANDIKINGKINGNVSTAAVVLNTSQHSVIEKGILGIYSNTVLRGTINGPVDLKSIPSISISGVVNGNLKTQGAPITWQAPLTINGSVNDYSGVASDPTKIKGINLKGKYFLHQPQADVTDTSGVITIISIVWFIGSLLASLILFRLFPRTLWIVTEPSRANFRRNILIGLISLIGIPIVILILMLTLVGIPLAALLGLIYLILLLLLYL
jgi:cytoskeletal protein CcmA (bactofilin family)